MNNHWAEQNLQVIRTLMERSAIYRRALGPIMWWAGFVAVASAGLGEWSSQQADGWPGFIRHWLVTGVAVVAGAFWLARRQARRDQELFWSPPARRVAQALLPALVVGLIVTGFCFSAAIVVGLWAMLYGCALHAAGFLAPKGLRLLGWCFILAGLGWWTMLYTSHWTLGVNVAMGEIFGGLHLAYALYLTVTARES
jgi:hypothetical protein